MGVILQDSMDFATKPGMGLVELENFLSEMRAAPSWRMRADMECDYYDSNQHTPEEIAEAELNGLPTITINLIAPTVNLVLGMEAKTRTDWTVKPDGPNVPDEFAQALEVKLQEAERVTMADSATADAYASQIKAGLGWVHVGRNMDPFAYAYRVQNIDRREIWWDMRADERNQSNSRYLVRRKWHDCDYLQALLPRFIGDINVHNLIDFAMDATAQWDMTHFARSMPMAMDGNIARDWFEGSQTDWRNTERRLAMLYEVWYRTWNRGYVMKTPDGRVLEFDQRNALHMAMAARGMVTPFSAVYPKIRLSWWLGPFRLYDVPTPYPHRHFPYIPFFGYQEDRTKAPYGMIRAMVPLQDEVNARRAKMLWQLSANRVIIEEDAVADHELTRQEINRPDAYVPLRKDRANKARGIDASIRIDEHTGLNAQQMAVYVDSKETLQQSAGVYSAMLGDAKSGADAGVAIDMLIQQGTTVLAKINDNYRFARTLVGEQLLALINADMAGQQQQIVVPGQSGRPSRNVVLNEPQMMPGTNLTILNNDTERLKTRVALAEVPSNPTYKQRVFMELSGLVKALPPELQASVIDLVVEASDLPQKHIFAERLRKALGLTGQGDPNSMSPQERQEAMLAQAEQQKKAALADKAAELALQKEAVAIHDVEAAAALKKAQAAAALVKAGEASGKLVADFATGEMAGQAQVEIETPEPDPVMPGASTDRDSTSFQSQGRT